MGKSQARFGQTKTPDFEWQKSTDIIALFWVKADLRASKKNLIVSRNTGVKSEG
jgi:hypothetical protein